MKKNLLCMLFCLFCLAASHHLHAQLVTKPGSPVIITSPVPWISDSPNDVITIHNGTGANLSIFINIYNNEANNAPGIFLQNCGDTAHVLAGSAVVCINNNSKNPVSFRSDSDKPATGTYQITQQLTGN